MSSDRQGTPANDVITRRITLRYIPCILLTLIADNGSRSRNRGIHSIAVTLKRKFKSTCQENFTTVRGCFDLGTARVKALGALKKEEDNDDETRFSPFL